MLDPMERAHACGIDVGFSETAATSAVAVFVVSERAGVASIGVAEPTRVLSSAALDKLIGDRQSPLSDDRVRLVTLDAPLTRTPLSAVPATGRCPDLRFSRGLFANSNRGPQPSSIRVPKQGWPLYRRGMALLERLERAGFPYVGMNGAETVCLPRRACMEVLPKLTLALLCPRALLAQARPRTGFFKQIDNWLFPHVFVALHEVGQPVVAGSALMGARQLLGTINLDDSVFAEAQRINALKSQDERHEAIGAFVAGFQGALALSGGACSVGDAEAHFLLPRRWHPDWEQAWTDTDRRTNPTDRVDVHA